MSYRASLPLSQTNIRKCLQISKSIGAQVGELVEAYSSVGIERGVLRLLGMNGAIGKKDLYYPTANQIVDDLQASGRLAEGALYWVSNAMLELGLDVAAIDAQVTQGVLNLGTVKAHSPTEVRKNGTRLVVSTLKSNQKKYQKRHKIQRQQKDPRKNKRPLQYVIVATGNIFEDVEQARAAVHDGADVIAVIRSTAQSLIDYVPHGNTTVGFGGTYATQANFKVMREALDEEGKKVGRYIRLTNYASGLCMAEITALAASEGLDCLLNDAMYGILFRDINMVRTLIDQHFSRLICAQSGMWIMTGEDNYLKTTDATVSGDSVLASQFINYQTAVNAGVSMDQMALGHAMEMDPSKKNVILLELARAQMTRQIFPEAPLKYMCNTKYKTGDIFTSHAIDTVFNFLGSLTGQGTLLLGMLTEAVHTPFLSDRTLSLKNANYISHGLSDIYGELGFHQEGQISTYAQKILSKATEFLTRVEKMGFLKAIEKGYFAGVRRFPEGGKGFQGVFRRDPQKYFNPFYEKMGSKFH